jgi:flagellar biosynthesis protein FlhG
MADEKRARRIAVISGKGGVGKTVITANLAAALSSLGRRILVIDADLGLANLDIILGVEPKLTIHDALHGICPLEEVVLPTTKGFDLLPAGSGLPEDSILTTAMAEHLESSLSSLENHYDAILFDAGAGVGDVVLHFADQAHEILLVVMPEPTSMMDAYATIKILHQHYNRSEFLLIVNQANPASSTQIGYAVANHLQNVISKFLGSEHPVRLELIGCIPQDPAIPLAIRQRKLIRETNPQAPSACLINHVADLLDARVQQAGRVAASAS